MKIILTIFFYLCFVTMLQWCNKNDSDTPSVSTITSVKIITDKACYSPGGHVTFTIDNAIQETVKVRYRHLTEVVGETELTGTTWSWTAPSADFTGYLVDIYKMNDDGTEHLYGSIAVDVSSDWVRFPRYGFLSKYPQLTEASIKYVISDLARYHINGLQFYDWHYAHHKPLSGTPTNPDQVWKDIANRDTYFSTVKSYIDMAHSYNMKAMFYNLAYGALSNAESDGVSDQWYMYTDASHTNKDRLDLPAPMFKSKIWLLDPSNTGWQQYIASQNRDVYQVLNFDGYHIDQMGNLNHTLYSYSGQVIDLQASFGSFIRTVKSDQPGKKLVMNAVNQYGQQYIAQSPVDFLYSEVWGPNDGYKDLAVVINDNNTISENTKNTVLAAYMNYDLANSTGFFNTPGVLLTNAVIFSFGGSHLELGEHMLCKEYFPNSNLQMRGDLRDAMISYYDFLVAYENLLRDGGTINSPDLSCYSIQMPINNWPPQSGKVSVTGRDMDKMQVIHLINFSSATSLFWRDNSGTQAVPGTFRKVKMIFKTDKTVKKVWVASPDLNSGTPEELDISSGAGSVSFTLPELKYWDMIVVEYQ
ncbi:MAG: cycloisomaltooligosaccharide glucanotransferase [Porphyromonadaceae bacterium]|nr:MAG: cycloisomaltooligosaccharide glucanotransferase [Porphyromonadaceae bacterium]